MGPELGHPGQNLLRLHRPRRTNRPRPRLPGRLTRRRRQRSQNSNRPHHSRSLTDRFRSAPIHRRQYKLEAKCFATFRYRVNVSTINLHAAAALAEFNKPSRLNSALDFAKSELLKPPQPQPR